MFEFYRELVKSPTLPTTVGGMFCLCARSLRRAGAIFAHRGATKMLLFVFPTIAPLRKIFWALSISLLQIVL